MKRVLLVPVFVLLAVLPMPAQDSLAVFRAVEAANRAALEAYAADVTVVATKRVPRKDFQLWYGHLPDRTWSPDGNWNDPAESRVRFFSRRNAAGDLDIMRSEAVDSVTWSAPVPFCADAVSPGDEIFPMLSPDGKRLYFSSDGLFGMGGHDLYVAYWNPVTRTWGNVQNMGVPYSSPADDLLFCDTEDGRFSVFASKRDCGRDSVVIYVLRQENPVSVPVEKGRAAAAAQLRVTAPDESYPFVRRNPGKEPDLVFEVPEPEIDDSFRVEGTGAFAENNQLPSGLVYQVQLFVGNTKPTIRQLKGVRPVYAHKQRSGKVLYAAGVFRTYAEAETALAAVRKAGHKGAIIIAFEDGKALSVSQARKKESSVKVITEEIRIVK